MENSFLLEMAKMHFQGNIIDNGWIENFKYENGKTNMNAVMILSEIVYWYRPTEIRDEITGNFVGWKKKFKADKLQKSYQALGDRFGITKRQAKLACDYLKDKKIIDMEFRTIEVSGTILNNVMYIDLNIENLKKITGIDKEYTETAVNQASVTPITIERNTYNNETQQGIQQNVTPVTQNATGVSTECKTNTKTTPETTPKIIFLEEEVNELVEALANAKGRKVTYAEKEKLYKMIQLYSKDLILKAIDIMVTDAEKITLKYITSTLEDWKTKEIQTVEEVDRMRAEWQESKMKAKEKKHVSKPPSKVSNFNNFKQREYDFKDLERKLLGWDKAEEG